ncbi:unnamed protein product [Paramecium pentaurelia]|uniref:Uncharacterized protein n=1 Tax=Paramecium pentaurelia TaxID=43138 RepID=A0A8S1TXD4_9CILI|nr:unnamed protein product [Paramecium pentaurelia]
MKEYILELSLASFSMISAQEFKQNLAFEIYDKTLAVIYSAIF